MRDMISEKLFYRDVYSNLSEMQGKRGRKREGKRDSNYDVTIAGVLGRTHLHVIRIRNRAVSRTLRGIEHSYFSKRFHNAEKAGKYTIART